MLPHTKAMIWSQLSRVDKEDPEYAAEAMSMVLEGSRAEEMIMFLRRYSSLFGVCKIFTSDGGSQFVLESFKEFLAKWEVLQQGFLTLNDAYCKSACQYLSTLKHGAEVELEEEKLKLSNVYPEAKGGLGETINYIVLRKEPIGYCTPGLSTADRDDT